MKKIFRKNQLIITTLAVMIAVAGYLNYSGEQFKDAGNAKEADSKTVVEDEVENTSDISAEDIYAKTNKVLSEEIASGGSADGADVDEEETLSEIEALPEVEDVDAQAENGQEQISNPGSAVLANSSEVGAIAKARLTREQTRAKNKEVLLEIINNAAIGEGQKQGAVQEMIDLTSIAEKEAAAEILLEAKGFAESVVSMQDGNVDVVVKAGELTDVQRAQIEDIVKRKTGVSGENIVITQVD